jgi:predicted TPR repeat methyltransferase
LGVVYEAAGQKDKAAAAYQRYSELDPDSGWSKKARKAKAQLAGR